MGAVTRLLQAPASLLRYRTAPQGNAVASALNTQLRRMRPANPQMYRQWSWSPVVRAAIDIRKGQIENADWDLVPFHTDGPAPDKGLMRRQRELLEVPNPADADLSVLLSAMTEDILTLDAGCVEKERMLRGEIAYLWPTDGAAVAVDKLWDGNPKTPRYYFLKDGSLTGDQVPLLNSDLVYTLIHRRSNSPIGMSYLEILKSVIDSELNGSLYNDRQLRQAAPDGIFDMGENARKEQLDQFKSFFEQEIAGHGQIGFWGGTKGAKFIRTRWTNQEMQFQEWLNYQIVKVAIVFQLSPQDLGQLFDVNRANGEVQQENTEDRGQRTLLNRVQAAITHEVCWDEGFGGRANNIAFRFRAATLRQSKAKAEIHKIGVANMPTETINQARRDQGQPPIGDPDDTENPANQLLANTPLGLVSLGSPEKPARVPTPWELAQLKAKPAPEEGAGKQRSSAQSDKED